MAQHFLLSAAARTLSLRSVYQGGEDKAYETFCRMRWAETEGKPICPRCGGVEAYAIKSRRKFECKACGHQFSVTSGTIFASRKMAFVDLLAAIVILANASKGVSMLQLSRDIDCQYKTAFVLAHKLREAIASEVKGETLSGTVEVDGAYFGGHVKPSNLKANRIDRRLAENQTGKRRVVVVARQRDGRTITTVTKSEADGVAFVETIVAPGSVLHADEAGHWNALHAKYKTFRINHQEAYSLNGACTNQAESFLARLRRMVMGQHHHVSGQYLHQFANEAAWKEDHRRLSNGEIATKKLALAMAHPVSREWKGYWQRAA
ncbi:putative transposase [Rhodomicrobium vannielii ATCC 17100]|uniref:Putative transposase n=2 Tax=Rhodomicrobium vannielii TaxID=1069 RepID=E3I283_RHOVT|nr:IS1595 family transposase [Rhodomicrobium vannielii]ADP72470.1 putative transposase [Rhodomicrobium vannielii ATCC 17100]